jgi:hypothetical protein
MPTIQLTSLTSSEPDDAPGSGDGQTLDDIQAVDFGTEDLDFRLRAERAGEGGERFYEATYSATDLSGNVSLASAIAIVPLDLGGIVDPIAIGAKETGQGTVIAWPAVASARWYNVVRGSLKNLHDTPLAISLGAVACVESGSLDTSTTGHEDSETPAAGEGFFYLAEYDDGRSSSFGTARVPKPRMPVSSGCPGAASRIP